MTKKRQNDIISITSKFLPLEGFLILKSLSIQKIGGIFVQSWSLDFFCILVLATLFIDYHYKNSEPRQKILFYTLTNSQILLSLISITLLLTKNNILFQKIMGIFYYLVLTIPCISILLTFHFKNGNQKEKADFIVYSIFAYYIPYYVFVITYVFSNSSIQIGSLEGFLGIKLALIYLTIPFFITILYNFYHKNHHKIFIYISLLLIIGILAETIVESEVLITPTLTFVSLIFYLYRNTLNLNTDILTNVWNRRFLETSFKHTSLFCTKSLLVFFIDIDKFKNINDQYGHQIGDKILMDVAKILKSSIYPCDYCVRIGGDEFLLLVDSRDIKIAESIKSKIQNQINLYNLTSAFPISVSIGYEQCPNRNFNHILKCADDKMYSHKRINLRKVE